MSHEEGGYEDPYRVDTVMPRHSSGEDEVELQWAAIERLPTYRRIRTSLLSGDGEEEGKKRTAVVDVTKMDDIKRRMFIDKLLEKVEEDNLKLLRKLKERIDRQTPLEFLLSFFSSKVQKPDHTLEDRIQGRKLGSPNNSYRNSINVSFSFVCVLSTSGCYYIIEITITPC